MPRTRLTLAAVAAFTAGAFGAPCAHADSITYVQGGNVWLAAPDGSQAVQVTTAGGYSSASQSDDGRILALKGGRFHLMDRWGDVLADFAPVGSGTAGSITLSGPFDPAISPDGTKVAYGFYVQYKSGDPNCGRPGGCMVGQLYTGTGYARSDGPVEWNAPGYRPQYSWTDPSWIDDQHTLLAGPTSGLVKEAAIDTAGDGEDALQWFSDPVVGNLYDGELTRQRTAAAFIGNSQGDHLLVYRTPGAAPADPERCLDAPAQGGRWSSPTWSPDGTHLAWAGPKGLYVADLSGIADGCPSAATIKVNAFAEGATDPDWGPAGLPGPKPQGPAPTPTGAPVPTPVPTSSPEPTPAPAGRVLLSAVTTSRSGALRSGLKVTVHCPSGKLEVTASLGTSVIAKGRASCAGKPKPLTLRLSGQGRRRLRAARKPLLQLRAPGATPVPVRLR